MKYWTTREGKEIRVKDMTTSHLENAINYLQRKIDTGDVMVQTIKMDWDNEPLFDWDDVTIEIKDWIKTFKRELKKRANH